MHYPATLPSPSPQKLSPELARYFSYPTWPVRPDVKILREKRKYVLKEVSFDLHLPEDLVERSVDGMRREVEEKRWVQDLKGALDLELEYTVKLDYYEAKGEGRKPIVLVSPILGGNMIVDWFASFFASQGMHAAIVHRRKPRYDTDKPLNQVEQYLRKSVIRTRQALDWLAEQPEVDARKVGSFGISYGGIVNTLTAAVEPRIQCHIIAMAGGPLADVILDSKEKAIRKYVDTAARQAGYAPEELRRALREAIRSDTLVMAPTISPDRVLLVIAYFDQVVGRRYSKNLWQALGKPQVIYTPLGHYSTLLTIPYLKAKALQFYRPRFFPALSSGNRGIIYSRAAAGPPQRVRLRPGWGAAPPGGAREN